MARHAALLLTATVLLAACQAPGGEGDPTDRAQPAAKAAAASTAQAPALTTEGVTVMGQGRITGQPDTLRATVGVHVVRPDADQAFDDAAAAAERVLDAVEESGTTLPEPVALEETQRFAADGGAPIMRGEQEVDVQVQATWALR